ncbi:MAG: MBL fold metallo-hydrolase, partial [Gemmatimonadales bacterium]
MSPWRRLAGVLAVAWLPCAQAAVCGSDGVWIQVLGSIEPGADGRPLSSSFLVWLDGKARVLVDTGNGSAGNFYGNGARLADLDVILLTYLHVDHTADLPTLIQASLPEKRARALPIYGPARSKLAPSTVTFVRTLFDNKRGLYRYLGAFLSPLGRETYKLQPHDVRIKGKYEP